MISVDTEVVTKIITADISHSEPIHLVLSTDSISYVVQENIQTTIILDAHVSVLSHSIVRIILQRNASIRLYVCLAQHALETITLEVILQGDNAQAQIYGVVALHNTESVAIKTVQRHDAPHTQSQVIVKALVAGCAQLKYEGLISVDKNAHNTNAAQQNKNMLLSEYARAYARPSLEVETNEVKCSHGTATGPLDKNQLLYLVSRGITEEYAQRLLMCAFITDTLQGLSLPMQEDILKKIMNKIEGVR